VPYRSLALDEESMRDAIEVQAFGHAVRPKKVSAQIVALLIAVLGTPAVLLVMMSATHTVDFGERACHEIQMITVDSHGTNPMSHPVTVCR
jgi:hypothetical protein